MWSIFKVNKENIRTTSLTYFIPFSSASIVEFEQVNVSWLIFVVGVELVLQQIQYRLITSKSKFFFRDLSSSLLSFCDCSPATGAQPAFSCSKSTIETLKQCLKSKLTIKASERRLWCQSGVIVVNFEQISHMFIVFIADLNK